MVKKARTVITTDMECDDMNSMIHLALHLNDINVVGIIYTSSQFHFNGDGIHTLGEITPNYRCQGLLGTQGHIGYPHPDEQAKDLKSYRPFEEGWIESLWDNEYREAYPFLVQHDPSYPTPEYLLSITKVGNIAFEGDVTKPSEGSEFLKHLILDDNNEILHIQSWGGANTLVRALMDIANEYKYTENWQEIYNKVIGKVVVWGISDGVGQDNSWLDYGKDLFPDLVIKKPENTYGTFFASIDSPSDCIHMFKGPWLKENIKENHGSMMAKYGLWNDGNEYLGEAERFQYGRCHHLNWGFDALPNFAFEDYDFLGEGDSNTYVQLFDVGLRGLENDHYGSILGRFYLDGKEPPKKSYDYLSGQTGVTNRFIKAYQQEFAARVLWCTNEPGACVHPPIVSLDASNLQAKPGEVVSLYAKVEDPDHKPLAYYWSIYNDACKYEGNPNDISVFDPVSLNTKVTIPKDSKVGDYFSILLTCYQRDEKFPITRYGQVIIEVIE